MSRETKVGLLVGMCVILLIGIIVSDHLSVVQRQEPAPQLTSLATGINQSLTGPDVARADNTAPVIRMPSELAEAANPVPGNGAPPLTGTTHIGLQGAAGNAGAPGTPVSTNNPGAPNTGDALAGGNPGAALSPDALDIHVVKHGDTLYKLAQLYYHRADQWALIKNANPKVVGPHNELTEGAKLLIPRLPGAQAPGTSGTAATPGTPDGATADNGGGSTTPRHTQVITVQPGDTLAKLAAKYLSSRDRWHDILSLNRDQLRNPQDLKIGMKLRVPDNKGTAAPDRASATVADSDGQPASPSAQTFTPVPSNPSATPSSPSPVDGPQDRIPNTPRRTDNLDGRAVQVSGQVYKVEPGDSIQEIAARTMGDSHLWIKIYEANRAEIEASNNQLRAGQVLVIPSTPDR